MSKNLTRKGLAFGALVALASTVIAGTPASAAGELNVVPSAGTSYNALAGTVFNLKTTFAPGSTPSSYAQLKYLVKTDANSVIKYQTGLAAVDTAAINDAVPPAVLDSVAVSTTSAAISAGATGATDVAYLGLEASTTSVTSSVEVTAFVDANNDGALTAGEWNTVRTVGFKKATDIVPVVTLTAPAAGATSVKASVAWGDLNVEQISDETVKFVVGSQFTATAGTLADGVWSKSATTALTAAEAVSAQAYIGSTALGTAATATASARTISSIAANVVTGSNAVAATTASTGNATTTSGTAASVVVRTDSAWVAQAKVLDTATTPVVKSGVAVVATVSTVGTLSAATSSASAVSVTVNGTTYTAKTGDVVATVNLTSDASGLVSLPVATAGGLTAAVVVKFAAQNLDASVSATPTAATYTVVSSAVGSALRSIAEGGSTTFNFAVKDQFGVAIGSGARLEAVVGYGTALVNSVGNAAATSYVPVTGGVASVTVTDTTASTLAAITVTTTLQTQSATTSNWAAASTPIVSAPQTVNVHSAAAAFASDPAAQTLTLSTAGTITTPAVNNEGAAVTIAAKGFTFTFGGVDYVDTITLFSAANGAVTGLTAKTNTAGAQTVTWTVGSVSKTAVVTVTAATIGKTITITAPTSATPGSTFTVSGTLVDAYGNPVVSSANNGATFSVTYSGPGFVVGGTMPTATSTSGAFSFQVLTGAADAGSGTVTVKYDADGASSTTIAEISKTATVLVAAPEVAATIAGATKKINYTIDNAKGELVIIKVANKTVKRFVAYSNAHAFGMKATKGSKAVKVYVAGDLVAAKTVSVK